MVPNLQIKPVRKLHRLIDSFVVVNAFDDFRHAGKVLITPDGKDAICGHLWLPDFRREYRNSQPPTPDRKTPVGDGAEYGCPQGAELSKSAQFLNRDNQTRASLFVLLTHHLARSRIHKMNLLTRKAGDQLVGVKIVGYFLGDEALNPKAGIRAAMEEQGH